MAAEKLAVIGTGYVGLVSGACFADIGHQVVCVDRDAAKIERLRQADIPIYEPGLEELVRRNMEAGRLRFTGDTAEAVCAADIVLIAVGTPALASGDVDRSQVEAALAQVAASMNIGTLVVIKSTVPVGTARWAETFLRERLTQPVPFAVASNPEFLREGSAIHDTFHADRIVIGADDPAVAARIAALHEPFGAPVLITNRETAELTKYAANAFLATKISFINEMANVCDKVGADIADVAAGIGMDRRIGPHFLQAGVGYGGSCFPKDTKAQLKIAENVQYDFRILRATIEVNRLQRERFVAKIAEALGGTVRQMRVAVMGLAFKPNTDDLRDAPAIDIIRMLQEEGADVRAYDLVATERAARELPGVAMFDDAHAALEGADVMAVVTEWDAVKRLEPADIKRLLRQPIVVDGRNAFDPQRMAAHGLRYVGMGRGATNGKNRQTDLLV